MSHGDLNAARRCRRRASLPILFINPAEKRQAVPKQAQLTRNRTVTVSSVQPSSSETCDHQRGMKKHRDGWVADVITKTLRKSTKPKQKKR